MVGEVKLSITRSWVQNLSLLDERSNRETSRKIGFYSVYLVSLQGLPFIQLYLIYIDLHRLLFIHFIRFLVKVFRYDVIIQTLEASAGGKADEQISVGGKADEHCVISAM